MGIAVREGAETWGILNEQGEMVLPLESEYIRTILQEMRETYIALSDKPEGVNFERYATRKSAPSRVLFYDADLTEYEFQRNETGKGTIVRTTIKK